MLFDAAPPPPLWTPPKPAIIRFVGELNRHDRRWLEKKHGLKFQEAILPGMSMIRAAGGAFPSVVNSQVSVDNSGDSSIVITLPGSLVVGNVLLAIMGGNQNRTATWPAGWTELIDGANAASGIYIGYRVIDGSEGASITVTASSLHNTSVSRVYQITGAGTTLYGGFTTGSSSTPDSPDLNPGIGSTKFLWFAGCAGRSGLGTISGYPTDFTDGFFDESTAGGARIATARFESQVASLNPSAFTAGGSDAWSAATVAVPAA